MDSVAKVYWFFGINSYMLDKMQFVEYKNFVSSEIKILSVVPQDKVEYLLFVDVLTIFQYISSELDRIITFLVELRNR